MARCVVIIEPMSFTRGLSDAKMISNRSNATSGKITSSPSVKILRITRTWVNPQILGKRFLVIMTTIVELLLLCFMSSNCGFQKDNFFFFYRNPHY